MWLRNLIQIIKENGGLLNSYLAILRTDTLKVGCFMGRDPFGNRYYENLYYFIPTSRWVIYSNKVGYDYDASQIHSTWFRWLHFMTDWPPSNKLEPTRHPWMLEHMENKTGTRDQYVPYSTTKPKIISWKPLKKLKQ